MSPPSPVREAARGRLSDDRAVSPTVSVALMVVFVVVLAVPLGSMTLSMGASLGDPVPNAAVETEYEPAGTGNGGVPYVNITHRAGEVMDGDRVFIVDSDGNEVAWEDVGTSGPTVKAGEFVHIDGRGSDCALNEVREGEVYRVVWRDGRTSHSLAEYEVTEPTDSPSANPQNRRTPPPARSPPNTPPPARSPPNTPPPARTC